MGRAEAGLRCKWLVSRRERTVGVSLLRMLAPISDWLPTAPCLPSMLWLGRVGMAQGRVPFAWEGAPEQRKEPQCTLLTGSAWSPSPRAV